MNDTIFYIILGVIYLIITALGRAAKKRQQQTSNEEPWSVEDALRDLQDSPDVQSETMPTTDWADAAQSESSFPASTFSSTPKYKDGERRSEKHVPASRSIRARLNNPKSAQTAIILSEILGRPKGFRGFPRPRR